MKYKTWRQCLQKAHKVYIYNKRHDHDYGLHFPISKKDVYDILVEHEFNYPCKKEIRGHFHTFPKEILQYKKIDGEYKDVVVEAYDLYINIGNEFWGNNFLGVD